MKIALVDDDPLFLNQLQTMISQFYALQHQSADCRLYQSAEDFLAALPLEPPDAVFLDIFLDGISGIEAGIRLRQTFQKLPVVFLTSSADFMPQAFSLHAFEYLQKPIDSARLEKVLRDMEAWTEEKRPSVCLSVGRQSYPVFLDDILWAFSEGHYLQIRLVSGQTLRCRLTMKAFQESIGFDSSFVLINKGILIHAPYTTHIENSSVTMQDGMCFPIRVRQKARIEEEIRKAQFEKIRRQQSALQWSQL